MMSARAKVYNVLGQSVATLVNEELKAGTYEVHSMRMILPAVCICINSKPGITLKRKRCCLFDDLNFIIKQNNCPFHLFLYKLSGGYIAFIESLIAFAQPTSLALRSGESFASAWRIV